jgi:hypothetical protein
MLSIIYYSFLAFLFLAVIQWFARKPDARAIESTAFYDMSLMEKKDDKINLRRWEKPGHPGRILLDSKETAKRDMSMPPSPAFLISKSSILENYKKLYDLSAEDGRICIRQMVMSRVPQFVRTPIESLLPSMC